MAFSHFRRSKIISNTLKTRFLAQLSPKKTENQPKIKHWHFRVTPEVSLKGCITPELLKSLPNEEYTVNTIYPKLTNGFKLQSGQLLPSESLQIKYATFGKPELHKPIILLCPSMSNSVHAMEWWKGIVGKGVNFGLNLDRFFIICGAPLGSPFGSTSPVTLNPQTKKLWKSDFPQITPRDQAKFQKLLLDSLNIHSVQTVIGGSMGGMQTLQFAVQFPELYSSFVSIAATGQTDPGIVALRSVQREIVKLNKSKEGMKVARMMGTIFYRSHKEFNQRFSWLPKEENGQFEVEEYLEYQGEKFIERNYDIDCWLVNSKSMDLQNIQKQGLSFEESLKVVSKSTKAMLLSYDHDRLTPAEDHERVARGLVKNGVETHFEVLKSHYGHDAFLIEREAEKLNVRLRAFLNGDVQESVKRVHHLLAEVHYP